MSKIASPTVHRQLSRGERVLDVLFGLGALVLLIPALPIIVLIWLWDRVRRARREAADRRAEADDERLAETTAERRVETETDTARR